MTIYNQSVNVNFAVNVTNINQIDALQKNVNQFTNTVNTSNAALNQYGRGANRAAQANDVLSKSQRRLNSAVKAFITFELSRFFSGFIRGGIEAQESLERLEDQLIALEGSVEAGQQRFADLRIVAADLPATFADVAFAANKMSILGFDATNDSISEFLDLSVGLGKPLAQIIEAFADAGAGFEFERLKELGIVAKQQTDSVIINFRGMEQEVAKTSEGVINGLREIARTNFDGAAELAADNFTTNLAIAREQFSLFLRDSEAINDSVKATGRFFGELAREARVASGTGGIKDMRLEIQEIEGYLRNITGYDESTVIGAIRSLLGGQARLDNIDTYRQQVADYGTEIELLAYTAQQAGVTMDSVRTSIGAPVIEEGQTDKQLKAYTNFVSGLQSQIARLNDVTNQSKLQALIPTLTDDQINEASELINSIKAIERRQELLKLSEDLTQDLGNAANNASAQYRQLQEDIIAASTEGSKPLGAALAQTLDQNALRQYREQLESFIGPKVIIDGTADTIRAAEEQTQRLNDVFRQGAVGRDVVNQFERDAQQRHVEKLRDIVAGGINDPFAQFRQELLDEERKFIGDLSVVNDEVIQLLDRQKLQLQEKFLDNFTIDLDESNGPISQIRSFNEELAKLTAATDSFTQKQISDEQIEQYEKLADALGLFNSDEQNSLGNVESQINALAEFNQKLLDAQIISQADFAANEAGFLSARLDAYRTNADQIKNALIEGTLSAEAASQASALSISSGFLQAFSDVTSGFEEQSRSMFELNKALDIGMAIQNYYVGITAAARQGPLGIISGLLQTGIFIKAIQGIRDREFGDTSDPGGVSGGSNGLSQQLQNQNSIGGGDTNINVTVVGEIIDNGGLEEAIINGYKTATRNNRLGRVNTTIRRR